MKLNINFLQTGGVPLTNDLMADIMQAIQLYDVVGAMAGNLVILTGCEVTGNTVSEGFVAINGEVLPFAGGVVSSKVFVKETEIQKTFEDGNDKVLVLKKSVEFGNAIPPNAFDWADFTRLKTLLGIQNLAENATPQSDFNALVERVELLEQKTAPIINGGVVFPWRKPVADIPVGWKECTDFRGKVIVGWNPNDADFATLGGELGEKKHTLSKVELPAFGGTFGTIMFANSYPAGDFQQSYSANAQVSGSNVGLQHKAIDFNVGSNQAHNNIQPSRIALYIEPNFQ